MGCARNPMADPGVFGPDCSCWCHTRQDTQPDSWADLLLAALASARHRRDQADRVIRLLLAYARQVITPRPYRLADLADAAGMSISGGRIAYTRSDYMDVLAAVGAGRWQLQAAVDRLADAARRQPTTTA
jgi:hypothetical protein